MPNPYTYEVQVRSRGEFIPVRRLRYHVRLWGDAAATKVPVFLLHGWMDVGATFQFVADAFGPDFYAQHYLIAPDWRGFGQTLCPGADTFWFPDYLGDLEALLDHYVGTTPAFLVGHSMGGNVAMQYAGVRPQRVAGLINLEGFGLPATQPAQAAARCAAWLDDLTQQRKGKMDGQPYDNLAAVARRLMKTNARLSADKALWLAEHWAREDDSGQWLVQGASGHRTSSPYLYRADEAVTVFENIKAPVLAVHASDSSMQTWWGDQYTLEDHMRRLKSVERLKVVQIDNASHMLHHDQPGDLAALIERFVAEHTP